MLRIYRNAGQAILIDDERIELTVAGISDGELVCFVEEEGHIIKIFLRLQAEYVLDEKAGIKVKWLSFSNNFVLGIIAPQDVSIKRDDFEEEEDQNDK